MQNQTPINGADISLPPKPCDCIEKLSVKMNKNHVDCHGLMTITDPQGKCVKGLHTSLRPKVIGSKPSTGLVVFNFCPFCGQNLLPKGTTDVEKIDPQT